MSPKEECERYLDCINQKEPAQGGAAVALYGEDSACWKGSVADAKRCGDACRTARTSLSPEGSKYPQCGCTEDAECPDSICATGVCLSAEWADAYRKCAQAAPAIEETARRYIQKNDLGCVGVIGADCEGMRGPDVKVYLSSLVKGYECMTKPGASLELQRFDSVCVTTRMCDDVENDEVLVKLYTK